jgi:hypothetical protein
MTYPLDAMMKAAAIAAEAAEPVTRIPFVKSGTPADDALAMLAGHRRGLW